MSNFNISQLKQRSAPQKSYLWKVEFTDTPNIGVDVDDLALHAQTGTIPAKEYSDIERDFGPHKAVYPGKGTKHGTVDVEFFMHSMAVYHYFYLWGQTIEDNRTGMGGVYQDYIANLNFVLLDHEGQDQEAEEIYEVELFLAYPKNPSGDLSLDYSEEGALGPHSVTMQYSSFVKRRL